MFLPQSDIGLLNKLFDAVSDNISTKKLSGLCKEASLSVGDSLFPFTYTGILLAVVNRIQEAIVLLEFSRSHPFSSVLRKYLIETGSFQPAVTVFQDTRPYDVWVKTKFYKTYISATIKAISEFAARNPYPKSNSQPVILDIGPGNGVLITEIINKLAMSNALSGIHLISLDQSPEMLKTNEEYCKKNVSVPIKVTSVCCKIQEILDKQLFQIKNNRPIWFVLAAASLHHMPWGTKIETLRKLRDLSQHFLITDFHANNDRPKRGSPEFVYSVTESYNYIIDDILNSPVAEEEKKLCINNLCLAEAINMFKYDWPARTDFHATMEEWKEAASGAGYKVVKAVPTISLPDRPLTFIMELYSSHNGFRIKSSAPLVPAKQLGGQAGEIRDKIVPSQTDWRAGKLWFLKSQKPNRF